MARIREIVIDAAVPAALARFWAAALDGYRVRAYDAAEIARLAAKGRTPATDPAVAVDGPGPILFFQETAEPKRGRNRLHLDLAAGPRARGGRAAPRARRQGARAPRDLVGAPRSRGQRVLRPRSRSGAAARRTGRARFC